ncbi:CarD family transcriptional regulator [Allofournierella sp.]|uniref:CarD family transcriptional regulator n=1 Tax=Allofournierella sp. TaxID=1940256 RepID=UPI003AB8DF35
MFCKGELIVYGNTGVCRVEDVAPAAHLSSGDKERLYYKLAPLYGSGFIYIPVETEVFMRPVLTRAEAEALIEQIPQIKEESSQGLDPRALAEKYRATLNTHECADLVQLIKSVYSKNQALVGSGKKPGKTDQEYMKRAEGLLHGELAVALEIPVDEVEEYIRSRVESGMFPQ